MTIAADAAGLRAVVDQLDNLWEQGSDLKEKVLEQIDAVLSVTGPSPPTDLLLAINQLRGSAEHVEAGQSMLTHTKTTVEEYLTKLGY